MSFHKPSAPPPPDPSVIANAQGTLTREQLETMARLNRPNQTTPYGSTNWSEGPNDQWSSTQTMDPRIVEDFFGNLAQDAQRRQLGQQSASGVQGTITDENGNYRAFNPTDIPGMIDRVDPNQVIGQIDTNGLAGIPNPDAVDRQRVENELYARSTSRLDPQFQQDQAALESQLTNQGFTRGSEAWTRAMGDFSRAKNDAYTTAREGAITGGGAEQSRQLGDALSAQGQDFGQRMQRAGFFNTASGQDFGQRVQSGQYQNAARASRFGEELTKRQQPFSEYQQLTYGTGGGGQPNIGGNTSQIAAMPPPDYTNAAMGQYAGQMGQYNAQMGSKNNQTSTIGTLAMAAATAY